ncbi:hypothetical protein [Leptospira perolatii]|uniref:hypothetical protein n=1 Tax=Leptospira perolatii TaxID=2023191 RepID=UPI001FAF79A0|nr:hypothetical protein [Leptospira perolatii]
MNKNLNLQEEVQKRKSDPQWSKHLASCVIQKYCAESGSRKFGSGTVSRFLAAAAILLLTLGLGWTTMNVLNSQEDEIVYGISSILEGEPYLSSLEE